MLSDIISALQYFGIKPEDIIPNFLLPFFASVLGALLIWILATRRINKVIEPEIHKIREALLAIQTFLKNNSKAVLESLSDYGQANSPIVLKDIFKPLVKESGLDKQIQEKEDELIKCLKGKNPKTGIDAQNMITNLVTSGEIEKYLDLTKYKQHLYEKGKTERDVLGILVVYLFEVLIPKLKFDGEA